MSSARSADVFNNAKQPGRWRAGDLAAAVGGLLWFSAIQPTQEFLLLIFCRCSRLLRWLVLWLCLLRPQLCLVELAEKKAS
jgi:hypothetical protein